MSGKKVLITGASGYVGFRVLIAALEARYQVVAAVRSSTKAEDILDAIKRQGPSVRTDQVSFVVISDLGAEGAFSDVLDGITYIIHVASPVPGDSIKDYHQDLIVPAVAASRQILIASKKSSSVKRVVFTSSVCAIAPWDVLAVGDNNERSWTPEDRIPIAQPPYQNQFEAYNASKCMALKEIEDYIDSVKPNFDVIHIFPGWVIGRDVRATEVHDTIAWTNAAAFGLVFGHKEESPRSPICAHIDDVAEAHIRALNPAVPGNRSFGACLQIVWDDANDIIRRNFPEEVEKGIFPCTGCQPSSKMLWDNGDVEEVLGMKFRGFEEQILSIAEHYLEALSKPGAKPVSTSWDYKRT